MALHTAVKRSFPQREAPAQFVAKKIVAARRLLEVGDIPSEEDIQKRLTSLTAEAAAATSQLSQL